jgi:hypothetical protein
MNIVDLKGTEFLIPYRSSNGVLYSPGRATFGGIIGKTGSIPDEQVFNEFLKNKFVKNSSYLVIRFPPCYYRPENFSPQIEFFKNLKVKNYTVDLNQHVDLSKWKYEDLSHGNRKKMRQFQESLGKFSQIGPSDFVEAYEILLESRKRLGTTLSIEKERLEKEIRKEDGVYKLFASKIANNITAVALTVQIDDETEYVLYWGDSIKYRSFSPVVSLFLGLRESFIDQRIRTIDLGVSSVSGITNPGLYRFKKNLGALESERITIDISI